MRACVCGWLTDWRVCMFGCVGVCVCSSLRRRRFCCLFSRERKTSCRLKGVCLETVNVPSKVVRPSLGLAARAPVTGRPPVRRNVPLDVVWYLNFSLLFFFHSLFLCFVFLSFLNLAFVLRRSVRLFVSLLCPCLSACVFLPEDGLFL